MNNGHQQEYIKINLLSLFPHFFLISVFVIHFQIARTTQDKSNSINDHFLIVRSFHGFCQATFTLLKLFICSIIDWLPINAWSHKMDCTKKHGNYSFHVNWVETIDYYADCSRKKSLVGFSPQKR